MRGVLKEWQGTGSETFRIELLNKRWYSKVSWVYQVTRCSLFGVLLPELEESHEPEAIQDELVGVEKSFGGLKHNPSHAPNSLEDKFSRGDYNNQKDARANAANTTT